MLQREVETLLATSGDLSWPPAGTFSCRRRAPVTTSILRSAAASDSNAAELQRRNANRRADGQRVYIDMLVSNGPLREGFTREDAAATYSALSNPATYALLVGERGWTADHFEAWLGASLTRLLVEHPRTLRPFVCVGRLGHRATYRSRAHGKCRSRAPPRRLCPAE